MGIEELIIQLAEEKGEKRGEKKGEKKAAEQKDYAFTKSLLIDTNFSVAKIASLANVTKSFVQRVKSDLKTT